MVKRKMEVSMKSPIIIASRGARFLDLVRQNKLNVSPQLTKVKSIAKEEKNYLKLSAKKFDPDASPTSSILSKRKAEPDSSPLTSSAKVRKKMVIFRVPKSNFE